MTTERYIQKSNERKARKTQTYDIWEASYLGLDDWRDRLDPSLPLLFLSSCVGVMSVEQSCSVLLDVAWLQALWLEIPFALHSAPVIRRKERFIKLEERFMKIHHLVQSVMCWSYVCSVLHDEDWLLTLWLETPSVQHFIPEIKMIATRFNIYNHAITSKHTYS